jgi:hypothetical protein
MSTRSALAIAAALCLVANSAGAKSSAVGYRAAVQIVVDTSSSMSALMGDAPAFQKALMAALKAVEAQGALPAQVEVSWRTFGGALPSDEARCEATELLASAIVTPGPVIRVALPHLKARGPRPLATGLEAAVGDLPREGVLRSIILITGGVDSCERDVCQMANELRDSVGLGQVHVILVNGDAAAASSLACVGKVSVAKTPEAISQQVTESLEALLQPAQITVAASDHGQDVQARVEVFAGNDHLPVLRARTGDPLQLAAGVYQLHVAKITSEDEDAPRTADPNAEGFRQNVELTPGAQLAIRVPLGGQRARLVATVMLNGQPAPQGTRIAIYHAGETDEAVAGGAPGEPIIVPPGRYDVRALIPGGPSGNIDVWKPEVTILPGSSQSITLAAAQKRGTLRVTVLSGGEQADDATVALVPAGESSDGQPLFQANVTHAAPVGTFTLVAQIETPLGALRISRPGVKVSANQLTALTVDVGPSARLTVEIPGRGPESSIIVGVVRAGQVEPAGNIDAFTTQRLPPGRYDLRIENPNDGAPRVYWYRHVELKPGDSRTVLAPEP